MLEEAGYLCDFTQRGQCLWISHILLPCRFSFNVYLPLLKHICAQYVPRFSNNYQHIQYFDFCFAELSCIYVLLLY